MLSNNNMLTTGGRSQRQRRCVRVNEPAYGFFVTGSSLEAMNGVYIRRNPPRVPAESADPVAALYYEHEDGLWHLSLNELPDANTESDDDEFDEDRLWYDPKPKKPTHEWVFTDEFGRTRFLHDGDTIIPGAGVRWKHAHRESTQSTLSVEEPSVSAVATISEDDEDELPWQVIAILDVETVQDLLWSSQCRKQKVKDAMAGRTAKSPAPSSLEGMFTPGAWLFRVKTAEGVTLFEEPSVESKEAGRRDCGEYLKGIEMSKNGDWLRLDSSEDNEGRHNSFLDDDNDDIGHFFSQRSKHHYYNSVYSRRELWVKIFEDNGWAGSYPLLEEIGPNETAVLGLKAIGEVEKSENQDDSDVMQISGHTGDYFDRPFVHRMEDGCQDDNSAPNISSEVDEFVESLQQDKLDGITAIPVGSAVYICGLSSRSERQYNNVPGIIVQTTDKFGKVGVRLSTPFSGKLISCHTDNVMFRQNDEDMELTDTDKSQAKGGKDELKRAAQLLGLMLTQIGLHNADSQSDDTAWGFRGHGAEQKVKTALRCFLRATNGVFGGEDIGRDAARVLLREIRKTESFSSSRAEDWAPCSPVRLISQGALGEDVAAAVRASLDPSSALSRKSGLSALQKCLVSEKRRVQQQAQAVYTMEEDIDLGESSHGADELLLRLALIQCLLENRREADALDEAKCLVKFEEDHVLTSSPDSSAVVSYLLGCCLLRLGMRGPGLNALENSKIVDLPESIEWLSPLQFWGFQEASRMMKVQKASEQYKAAAVESYSRGSFEEAASLYAKAIEILEVGCIEDKHGRAMCLADKAGCLRRARQLEKAVEELDAALRLFPRYTRALFRRAACLLEVGKASDAIEAFKTLYRVDRNWPHLSEWLVRAYTLRKRQSRGNYRPPDDGQQYDNPRDSKMNSAESTPLGGASSEADSIAVEVDLYAVLGVSTDATDKQLKTAYRMRSLKYHPDKKGGHTSAFQRIAEAYDILSDPEKRQAYDEGGDIKVKRGRRDEDDDSDDSEEEHKTSMREEVEREFYPEKYHFWPFGDPFIYKRKREAQKRKKQGRPAWQEDPWL